MFKTNLNLFIDSVFVYLYLKFIRILWTWTFKQKIAFTFFMFIKTSAFLLPKLFFKSELFSVFKWNDGYKHRKCELYIFQYKKNSNVFSYYLSFKNKFLNKINKFNSSTSQLHSVAICKLEAFCWQGRSSPKQTW